MLVGQRGGREMVRSAFAVIHHPPDASPVRRTELRARAVRVLRARDGATPSVDWDTDVGCGLGVGPDPSTARVSAIVAPGSPLTLDVDRVGHVGTDGVGLSHGCWGRIDGHMVVSDSALVVAAVIGASLDPAAVGLLSLVGFLLGGASLYEGVHRLGAGERLDLTTGRTEAVGTTAGRPTRPDGSTPIATGAEVLRAVLADLLEAHPDPVLELSGGLDSRAVLAALPVASRRGLRAVTLGPASHPDVRVAAALANASELDWTRIDPGDLATRPPAEVMAATVVAARQRDHVTNAVAAAALDHAEARIPVGARLTGANGEFARGFYYPGVVTDGPVTRARINRLVTWRLVTNDGTAARALDEVVVATARDLLPDRVAGLLPTELAWRAAMDEFYLTSRMANWAGPSYSSRDPRSPALAPFMHPDFLAWARSLPNGRAARERAFAGMVHKLDPGLAAVPLDRGPTVSSLAATGAAAMARNLTATAAKTAHKVDQRVRRRGKAPVMTDRLAAAVRAGWSDSQSTALEDTGLFRPAFLAALRDGQPVDPPTLSLAINVASAHDFLDRHATVDRPITEGG